MIDEEAEEGEEEGEGEEKNEKKRGRERQRKREEREFTLLESRKVKISSEYRLKVCFSLSLLLV